MFRNLFFILLFFCIVIINNNALADEKVVFGTFPIPLMVEDKDHGVFVDLTKTIAQRAKIDIEIVVYPPKRVLNYFMRKKIDIFFPALDVNFPKGIEIEKSKELIYTKEDFVFTKKGNPLYRTIPDLENKKIGITLGYPYVNQLIHNNLIKLEQANEDIMNAKKLISGRIDAFVVEEKSGLKSFEQAGLQSQMQYDPKTPLSRQNVYYAFQATTEGVKLSQLLSTALKEIKQDGTFAEIMKKNQSQ